MVLAMSALVLAYPACSSNPTAENKTETPRPTTTAVLTTDVLRLAESPRLGTGPEVTMTVDSDMALALEEPQPVEMGAALYPAVSFLGFRQLSSPRRRIRPSPSLGICVLPDQKWTR
ncbi:MAG: hypothetical protein C4317_06060 [Acidimicrobiia bacterium]